MIKRKDFSEFKEVFKIPNLTEVQLSSYNHFLQLTVPKTKRKNQGLQAIFNQIFPIESFDKKFRLEFVNYIVGKQKYSISECKRRGLVYSGSLRALIRLRTEKETKEQEVYLGEIPLMTETGTFIINGDERVVVSQLHRSPGVSFEMTIHPNGEKLYSARLIPARGSWIEFDFDLTDTMYVHIDRKRKFVVTLFLRALGYSEDKDILKFFCEIENVRIDDSVKLEDLESRVTALDIKDERGNILVERFKKLSKDIIKNKLKSAGVNQIKLLKNNISEIVNSIRKDNSHNQEEALIDIYRKLRPGDPPDLESAKELLNRMFFDPRRYDLSRVGRFILNRKLKMKESLDKTILTKDTVMETIGYLLKLKRGEGEIDDIDHLGNRRIRTVGELLGNQFQVGLTRIERSAKERMNIYDPESMMPHNLINSKLVSSIIRDFFARSQLSQFMDQTNPLAELTHKRRLSALGPGGLSRERAGFEVRDVHPSHYGRICPIETPEGPNIGLIASLSIYARINDFGFLEVPYRKVVNGRVTKKTEYLTADIEDRHVIAQANAKLDNEGNFLDEQVSCRYRGTFPQVSPSKINYMDISPRQLVSIAAGLTPFLEHDDANRALMGSNMQRQAVPLLFPEAPLVGTGMEQKAAVDSASVIITENNGRINEIQADSITIGRKTYRLKKFARSNADTCINQRPLVKLGQKVKTGDIIADGAATCNGELALGRNVLVAFMPWRGYNFEDAILISEKLVKKDIYTSIHVEEFVIEARDTRLGAEEITRDIPNMSEEALQDLDETGIVRIGAWIKPGDILVGKITPKIETELTPEEKLLRAIFGEKAGDVRDASLTASPGVEGVVVNIECFSRKEAKTRTREERTKELKQIEKTKKEYQVKLMRVTEEKLKRLSKLLVGQKVVSGLINMNTGEVLIPGNRTITKKDIPKLKKCDLEDVKILNNPDLQKEAEKVLKLFDDEIDELTYELDREIDKIKRGDELPPGVIKRIVVYIASKRKLSVGDKMAGRHGNKGVIAKILPEKDMPFLPDGTSIEIVLNPLGVPSRMNVGQILETHLGWASKCLGFCISTPVFSGITETQIKELLKRTGLPENGKIELRDGLTGKPFDMKITVGYIYIMKLVHLVDDKIHARSIGPYSLVTQQPLGGKAQFGGQRFGEMEVWALEGYGAAYTLQELLTVKSDDVQGRTKIYEAIVKGDCSLQTGTPESLNVLIKELQSLGLDIKIEKTNKR